MPIDALGISTEQLIQALYDSGGIPAVAAEKLKCSSRHVRDRIAEEPEIAQALVHIKADKDDFAEFQLFDGVRQGVSHLITFYLLQHCRDRGYQKTQFGSKPEPAAPSTLTAQQTRAALRNLPPDRLDELERIFSEAEPRATGPDA